VSDAAESSSRAPQGGDRSHAICSAKTASTTWELSPGSASMSRVTALSRGVSPNLARRRCPRGPNSVRHPCAPSRLGVQRKALSLGVDADPAAGRGDIEGRSGICSALSLAHLVDVLSTVTCFDLIGITTCAKGVSAWMQSGWVGFCHK